MALKPPWLAAAAAAAAGAAAASAAVPPPGLYLQPWLPSLLLPWMF
jgi:hypothetical protein